VLWQMNYLAWFYFHKECSEKDVFSFLLDLGLFRPEDGSLGTGSLSSFIVVTNIPKIMVQTLAILFNPRVIKISIALSNNMTLKMFVKG
jgi:hypothetical protein